MRYHKVAAQYLHDSPGSGKRKAKRSFTVSVKTSKGTEEKATLKGTKGMARIRGSGR
jgi:hypothetical protein